MKVKLKDLNPNPFKKEINEGKLNSLQIKRIKSNIKELGLMGSIPIVKRKDKYVLVSHHHRVKALKETFGSNLEVEIVLHNYSDEQLLRGMVIENLTQRADELLEITENLKVVRNFLKKNKRLYTSKDVAKWLNKNGEVMSNGKVDEYLKVYDNLDRDLLKQAVKVEGARNKEHILSVEEAKTLSRLDKGIQKKMKDILDETGLNYKEESKLVTKFINSSETIKKKVISEEILITELDSSFLVTEPTPDEIVIEETANNVADDILSNLHNFHYNTKKLINDMNLLDLSKSKSNKVMTTAALHLRTFKELVNILRQRGAKPEKLILELIRANNGKI